MKTRTICRLFLLLAIAGIVLAPAAGAKIYKYQRADGTWVFTDDPTELPEEAQSMEESGRSRSASAVDLLEHLQARLNPRTEIEKATLATVVVQSAVGRGSGFFISDAGHILTNRHVIRTPESRKRLMEARSEQIEMKIQQYRKRFAEEQARLDAAMAELESYKGRLYPRSYTKKKKEFQQHQEDLDRRQADFAAEVEEVRDQIEDEEYKGRMANIERYFTVMLADRTELRAHLVALSDTLDLALLKVDGHRTPHLTPAAPYSVPTGGRVYAIGNPIALHHSVAEGVLSGYERGYIKTDAKIYPGNSGGPLVSRSGKVLGVNTFKKLTRQYEGLGFAIPVQAALSEFARHLDGVRP